MPIITPRLGIHLMSYRTLLLGRAYKFLYPSHNFDGVMSGMEHRRCLVQNVRDTSSNPLDEETVSANPLLKRGRWLVTGIDLDKHEERSFYVESMIAVMEIKTPSVCSEGRSHDWPMSDKLQTASKRHR